MENMETVEIDVLALSLHLRKKSLLGVEPDERQACGRLPQLLRLGIELTMGPPDGLPISVWHHG